MPGFEVLRRHTRKVHEKRRVADLMAEGIPEDEAFLMKNGRFACTVCQHRPVFDTVVVLGIHRGGKKHQASVEHQKMKQRELEELKIQRKHEMYLKTGKAELLDGTHAKHLGDGKVKRKLTTAPKYDPRAKPPPGKQKNKRFKTLDLLDEETRTIEDYVKQQQKEDEQFVLKPYQRKHAHVECRRTQEQSDPLQQRLSHPQPKVSSKPSASETSTSRAHTCMTADEAEAKRRHELYWRARGAGWKKDCAGNWVKDDDVEFDSDEEPPDLP
ncbi:hypothetical protein CAPTEDRAFT_223183 [Capitella teleta]|uniref:Sodium channel modifier 1 n=1 Tax=Capitella teleta TaxID=283909 RepID=R7T3V8_CAPTE|nr:hypothetical protein CAPTEDRAFT_223183 [Capitella teleta]|eukprot:ELT87453.1 hypothetical protein CAPTEDRAFT_223183 [Capitella teleta]